ncbi:AAA family ATPase [Shewanella colwelliana]|uniref:AAA family ATPase n=1 Tax=Shewanella colwelliana TaxID=23 RepID=UPI0022AF0D37|nr:AAA family ATPase [Shewanella colwelliana]MCZ4339407.1 AAA family ATPase [Shewanella colwelliana]
MIIKSLTFKDSINKIDIEKINFDHMTVFVGTSGAGKTTIMNALATIKDIAKGESSPGDSWEFEFIDNEQRIINWKGKFSTSIDLDDNEEEVSNIESEEVTIDGVQIIERKKNKILFANTSLPSLDKYKSMLYLLRDDDLIKTIYSSIERIVLISNDCHSHTQADALRLISNSFVNQVKKKLKEDSCSGIRHIDNIHLSCREKIYFSKNFDENAFDDFEFIYTSIFPSVKSIKVELKNRYSKLGTNSNSAKSVVFISLELENGEKVSQPAISSGMFKSMMILADLILSNHNEVIIIDEVENSLGINCLPDIITEMKGSRMQCIFSTHHPKIINDISPNNWQIVNRQNNTIKCYKSEELIKSESKHDKFIQLMNNDIYLNGNI